MLQYRNESVVDGLMAHRSSAKSLGRFINLHELTRVPPGLLFVTSLLGVFMYIGQDGALLGPSWVPRAGILEGFGDGSGPSWDPFGGS